MPHNRICELLRIRYPIIQGGMVWTSGWKLASAVSNAGGLGLIGSGSMNPDLLREHIRKCKAATKKSYGVNIPLLYKHTEEYIPIIIEEKVPIVVSSAGSPKKYCGILKEAGITVGHVVPSAKLAKKCEAAGVDFVIAEGFEAGGHNGIDEITSLSLIPQVAESLKIPFLAAGGIGTGAQIYAAMIRGADGVQIGTRFASTNEASCHENFKHRIVNAAENDTILTLKELVPVRLSKNEFYQQIVELKNRGEDTPEKLSKVLGRGRAKKGIFEGDMVEGELEFGQVSGLINDIPTVSDLVKTLILQFNQARQKGSQIQF